MYEYKHTNCKTKVDYGQKKAIPQYFLYQEACLSTHLLRFILHKNLDSVHRINYKDTVPLEIPTTETTLL